MAINTTIIPRDIKVDNKTLIKDTVTGEVKVNLDDSIFEFSDVLNAVTIKDEGITFEKLHNSAKLKYLETAQSYYYGNGTRYSPELTVNANYFKAFYLVFFKHYNTLDTGSKDYVDTLSVAFYKDGSYITSIKALSIDYSSKGATFIPTYIYHETDVTNTHKFKYKIEADSSTGYSGYFKVIALGL